MSRGFTLIELLIYSSIFAVIGVVLTSIFVVFLRVDVRESASAEISNQANFVLQRIQNYIGNASFLVVNNSGNDEIDDTLALPYSKLIIKDRGERTGSDPNADDPLSPITIFKEGDFVKVKQGQGTLAVTESLNSNKVKVTNLTFTKVSNHPGRDSVIINLTLEHNNPTLPKKISRTFALGVGKASAAIFDTNLNPGANNTLDIGVGNRWRDLFLSGKLEVGSSVKFGSDVTNNPNVVNKLFQGAITGISVPATTADTNRTLVDVTLPDVTAVPGDRVFLIPTTLPAGIVLVSAIAKTNGKIDIIVRNTAPSASTAGTADFHFLLIK